MNAVADALIDDHPNSEMPFFDLNFAQNLPFSSSAQKCEKIKKIILFHRFSVSLAHKFGAWDNPGEEGIHGRGDQGVGCQVVDVEICH